MSQEEQDAIIGRNLRERKELKQKIELLKAKAGKQGNFLKTLGTALEVRPELVAFNGSSTGANSLAGAKWWDVAMYPQFQDIMTVGNELREAMAELQKKEIEADRLGIQG